MKAQKEIKTKIGHLYLIASEFGLEGIHWEKQSIEMISSIANSKMKDILRRASSEIKEYLDSERKYFSVEMNLKGTPFQMAVWNELFNIEYGTTKSYQEIANLIGRPNSVRAVGTAIGKNPLCLMVPCHRVITSSGKMGGYSGGVNRKRKLLLLEKNNI